MPVNHLFVSPLPDGSNPSLVRPSNWNANHVVSISNIDVDSDAGIEESKLSLNYPTHPILTLDIANGLSLVGQALSLGLSDSDSNGALSFTDWNIFNNKQNTLTFPLSPSLGGTGINNGSNNLTVPATMTAAGLEIANTFTGVNNFTLGMDANSVFIGGAGNITMSGAILNVGIGIGAVGSLTSGDQNVGIGPSALLKTTTGSENFGLGFEALYANTTGSFNVALGTTALRNSDAGLRNMAIGRGAMYGVPGAGVSWNRNVAIGYNALRLIAHGGNDNIGIGYQAGVNIGAGNRNIFIGSSVAQNQIASSDIFAVDMTSRASLAAEQQNSYLYGSMAAGGYLQLNIPTTTTNAIKNTFTLQAYVSTAATGASNGFGVGLPFFAETATDGTYQQQGLISTSWIDATNATRKANLILSAYDTAQRIGLTIAADGTNCTLTNGGKMIGVTPTTGYASFNFPSGVAPSSPVEGDMWNDSTRKVIQHFTNGITKSISGVIFTQTADKNINNTVTETTLFGTGVGTLTLPANYFVIGKEIRLRIWGYFSTTGNPNIQFKLKYGSTVLIDSGAFSAGTNVANQLFYLDLRVTCRTTGTTGTVYSQGFGQMYGSHVAPQVFDMETTSTVTINTTTSNALDITATWGTADTNDTITSTNSAVEILN